MPPLLACPVSRSRAGWTSSRSSVPDRTGSRPARCRWRRRRGSRSRSRARKRAVGVAAAGTCSRRRRCRPTGDRRCRRPGSAPRSRRTARMIARLLPVSVCRCSALTTCTRFTCTSSARNSSARSSDHPADRARSSADHLRLGVGPVRVVGGRQDRCARGARRGSPGGVADPEQQRDEHPVGDQRRAALGQERRRQAGQRDEPGDAADDDEDLQRQGERQADGEQLAERRRGPRARSAGRARPGWRTAMRWP